MVGRLKGLHAVVTEADDFMGPAVVDLFQQEGATVLADRSDLTEPMAANALVAGAGRIDVLIVNLSIPNPRALAHSGGWVNG
jgi:2-keto-3-deoxy-L-fuconate dehydrogenase